MMKRVRQHKPADSGAEKSEFSLIPLETLRALYQDLLKRSAKRPSSGRTRAGSFLAAQIALSRDLITDDTVYALADHIKLGKRSATNGVRRANGSSDAQLIAALAAALSHKAKKSGKVTVVWWNGGNTGSWQVALESARALSLPIIFVCDKTESAASPNGRRQKAIDIEPGTELPCITVDGNDVIASYRVAHEAIDRARRDRGPTLIECASFRLPGQRGRHLSAVSNMEAYLRAKNLLPAAGKRRS